MPEQPLTFTSGSHRLVGILHQPIAPTTPRRGVLFLAPNVQAMAGSWRFHVRMARYLASRGFWAFRFDFPGLGDSEGTLIPDHHFDGFAPEVTKAVTMDAIHTFCHEAQLEDVILYGLCGGARSALRAAAVDGRVRGLVLLSLPLMRNVDVGQPGPVMLNVQGYVRKARHGTHWKRFLTFQSDYRYFWKAFWRLVLGRVAEKRRVDADVVRSVLVHLERGQRILFIYGSRDPFYEMFEVGLRPQLSRVNGKPDVDWTLRAIPDGAHTFPRVPGQRQAIEEILSWLASRYPVHDPVRSE